MQAEYQPFVDAAVAIAHRLPTGLDIAAIAKASNELRKHRELSFYGADDLIPTEAYDRAEGERAYSYALLVLDAARRTIGTTVS